MFWLTHELNAILSLFIHLFETTDIESVREELPVRGSQIHMHYNFTN